LIQDSVVQDQDPDRQDQDQDSGAQDQGTIVDGGIYSKAWSCINKRYILILH